MMRVTVLVLFPVSFHRSFYASTCFFTHTLALDVLYLYSHITAFALI